MNPEYRLHHPRWHRDRMPIFWWLRRLAYVRFIARELTSLFVAYAVGLLLVQVYLAQRPDAYARFVAGIRSPPIAAFHVVVLLALLFHTITWLNLAPRAIVVQLRGRRVPGGLVLLGHYAAWLAASAFLAWVLLP